VESGIDTGDATWVLISAALCAFVATAINSYKRLVPGYEAPANPVHSARSRSASVHIPVYMPNPKTKRLEYRPPDGACNPYLPLSVMLIAGIDGIENQIDAGAARRKTTNSSPRARPLRATSRRRGWSTSGSTSQTPSIRVRTRKRGDTALSKRGAA
jgi:hypothetical protein